MARPPESKATTALRRTIAWITWGEIADVVQRQTVQYRESPDRLAGTIDRLAFAITNSIEWHRLSSSETCVLPPRAGLAAGHSLADLWQ